MRRIASIFVVLTATTAIARAQEPAHPAEALVLDAHIGWVDDGASFLDGRRPKRKLTAEEAAVDRGAILDAAIARAAKENKLVLWYVPRISEGTKKGVQMYRAPVLDIYMRQVVFCDPDVTGIIESAFVPVRMVVDEAMADRFDIRPLEAIEPAIVFLDGEGKVVHYIDHIRTFNAHWFACLLVRVLKTAEVRPPEDADVEEWVAWGFWQEALERLEARGYAEDDLLDRARYFLQLSSLQRRLRRLDETAASLGRVSEVLIENSASDPRIPRPERYALGYGLWYESGLQALLLGGKWVAREQLEEASRLPAANGEAGYHLAWLALREGDAAAAAEGFRKVAERFPDTLAGRRALANVTLGLDERPMGATFAGFECFGYLPDAAYVGLPKDTRWAGEAPEPRELAAGAVRFLLAQQHSQGGWRDARYAYWPSTAITPNTWMAISGLAVTAISEYRRFLADEIDLLAIDSALSRGEAYLFDPANVNRGENEEVYADAFRLIYLAARARTESPRRNEWIRRMNELVTEAGTHQREDGFFAHEYPNAFCTGAMLWSLLEAQGAGANVPEKMLMNGVSALLSARAENRAYVYGGSARGRDGSLKDSSGRMPICEAVLLRRGHGNPADLEFAIENFWEHFDRLETVRRNDFHSDGELAGFFFFHDLFLTSETLALLPESMRKESADRLLKILLEIPELDGSFIDSHEFGRSYATAMALLTLRNVADEGALSSKR